MSGQLKEAGRRVPEVEACAELKAIAIAQAIA